MLLGPLFWYCEIQGFHTFLGLRRLNPHQGSAPDLSGAYNVPRPPAVLSNDLRLLHILSKTRLSIPHLLGGGGAKFKVYSAGEENFLTLPLQENYIPPPPHTHTHGNNDTSLKMIKDQIQYRSQSLLNLARGYFRRCKKVTPYHFISVNSAIQTR